MIKKKLYGHFEGVIVIPTKERDPGFKRSLSRFFFNQLFTLNVYAGTWFPIVGRISKNIFNGSA